MLQSIKRLTKHSAVYGIGYIVSRSIGFLLLPIHTNYLLPGEYGIAALLFSSLAIMNIIFSYGMDVAFLRFFILEDDKHKKHTIFSTAFWMIFGTGLCFSSILVLFPTPFSQIIFRTPHYIVLVRLAGGILLADTMALIPFLLLRGEEKSVTFITLKLLNVAANFGLNILFVAILKKGVVGVFTANLIASVFTLITVLPILLKWLVPRFKKETLFELLRFGLPYVPSGLSVIIMDQIGRFFLDRMIGEKATGIFSASYKLGMFMALVVAAFRFAWHPFFLSTSKQDDAPRIFARVLTYFLAVTGFVFLTISYFIDEIVHFHLFGVSLFGEGYTSGIKIVPIIMLAYIGYGIYVNFIVGVYLKKKTSLLPLVTGIGAAVSILANFLLIPHFGIVGAAWATFLAYGSMTTALYLVSHKLYPIPYEIGRIFKLLAGGAILFILGIFVFSNGWMRLFLLMSFPFLLWMLGFFNKGEKLAVGQFLNKRLSRFNK